MKGTISEINFRDEFGVLERSATISDVAGILHQNAVKVVLVRQKKEVIGVLTQQHFLRVCATGINPQKTMAFDYIQSNLLHLDMHTPISEAIAQIEQKNPDAIIVVDGQQQARGYLSPADFRDLKQMVDSSQTQPSLSEVLRLVPTKSRDESGESMRMPNQSLVLTVANRGTQGHGVQQLHLAGARITMEPKLMKQGEQIVSLWPLNSVENSTNSLEAYLEMQSGVIHDGTLVMLMDVDSAIANLEQQSWVDLYKSSNEYKEMNE